MIKNLVVSNKIIIFTPLNQTNQTNQNFKAMSNRMTRAQMAEIIVNEQISRGVISEDRKAAVIHGWLHGAGACKPTGYAELKRIVGFINLQKGGAK